MHCNHGRPIFEWKSELGEITRILNADHFSTERLPGECDTAYKVTGMSPINGLNYCGASWQIDPKPKYPWTIHTTGKVIGIKAIKQDRVNPKYGVYPNGTCNGRVVRGTTYQYLAYLDWEGQSNPKEGGLSFFDQSFKGLFDSGLMHHINTITRKDNKPDDCGDCLLTFFKNQKVVYQTTSENCPHVKVICEGYCPENTCECDHGSYVCCIDKQGYVVQTIIK